MPKVRLELDRLSDAEVVQKAELIVKRMTDNPLFPDPAPPLEAISTQAEELREIMRQRDALLQEAHTKTTLIRAVRTVLAQSLTAAGSYVQDIANASTDPDQPPAAIIIGGGMDVAEPRTRVGVLPKVVGVVARPSESDGRIELRWKRIKRGLRSYLVEYTDDPKGETGWRFGTTSTKTRAGIGGLTSGQRYWFRAAAVGTAGRGPWSDRASKVAP